MARKSINLGTFTTNTESKMVSTASFKVIILTLITVNFTGTIKFFVSNSDYVGSPPNLSSVASTTNEYSEVIVVNLGKTELPISWDIGVLFNGSSENSRYEINDNNSHWFWIKTSNVTSGSIEVKLDMVDNQW